MTNDEKISVDELRRMITWRDCQWSIKLICEYYEHIDIKYDDWQLMKFWRRHNFETITITNLTLFMNYRNDSSLVWHTWFHFHEINYCNKLFFFFNFFSFYYHFYYAYSQYDILHSSSQNETAVSRSDRIFKLKLIHLLTKFFQWKDMSIANELQEIDSEVKSFSSFFKFIRLNCSKMIYSVRLRLYILIVLNALKHSICHIKKTFHINHFQWFSRDTSVRF